MERKSTDLVFKIIIKRLLEVISSLLAAVKQMNEKEELKYQLVDWSEKKGICYCRILITGTGVVNNFVAEEIVADDSFITGFSKIDVRTISNLANHFKYKPKSKVHSVLYDEMSLKIINNQKGVHSVSIPDLLNEKIEDFSQLDAFNIGRIVGERDVTIESK